MYIENTEEIVISEKDIQEANQKFNITPIRPVNMENYKPLPLEEMAYETPPKTEYIFYPCMPTQGICWIYAATGMGKTMFTLNLAYAIASGGKFLNYTCPKPRKVLYIDGEMAYNQLHARVMTIRAHQGEMDYPGYLQFITPDKIQPIRIPKIDTPEGQYIYEKLLVDHNFEVIVFDNCSVLSAIDQRKGCEWQPILDWELKLRSLGKSVINVHHAGKDVMGYRGASDMLDTADVAISLQPVNQDALEEELMTGKKFKVVYGKNRNFGGKDAFPFEVTFQNGIWTSQSMEKSEMERVVEMYGLKMNQIAIANELKCGQSKVAKLIKKARLYKLIRD